MAELNPIVIAIMFLLLAAGFFLLTQVLLRAVPRIQPLTEATPTPPETLPQLSLHSEAILLIQSGGRVAYINQQAREWFNLWEEEPNLERLARRARPSEAFLSLCASEGQARISLDGLSVEGTSYFAPHGSQGAILVSFRRPQLLVTPGDSHQTDISSQALTIFAELSQAMAASLDLETTLQAIMEGVERLIPSDYSEITIWDAENGYLVPYRFVGLAGVDRHMEKTTERYQKGQGYSGYLAVTGTPLLIADVNTFREVRPAIDRLRQPFNSYVGVPLQMAGDFIGTVELSSLERENFSQNDVEVLNMISGQAAIALHNALLYKTEQQRVLELAGLANLAQAVSSLRDLQDLFSHLIDSITPLLDVEILGFLLYDENKRTLEGQYPFFGLQANVIEWARTTIQPDSPAEEIWQSEETIVSNNAPEDPRLQAMELHHLAFAAGIQRTVLMPLTSGGRMLGYLQAADKRDGTAFDQDDLRLLAIVAGQAAPIIENASLVQQSHRRAQRAETLRRIASLTGSSATLDEILKYSILDLVRLVQAEAAAIFLVDEARGELRLHKPSLYGVSPEIGNKFSRVAVDDPVFPQTVTGSQRQFVIGNVAEAQLLPLYSRLLEAMQVTSVINVPLIVRERGIGEVILASFKPDAFERGDVLSAATAAGQLAAAVEQTTLYSQTDQNLRQRVDQMTALTRISRELNSTLDLNQMLPRVYEEALRLTRCDCGTISLFEVAEDTGEPAKLAMFLGEDPGKEPSPLDRMVLNSGETLLIQDFTQLDENLLASFPPDQPPQPSHPGNVAELIVPIAYQEQVVGLIHLHAKTAYHFDEVACEVSEALAIQAAIALANHFRYQDQLRRSDLLNRRVETLSKLFETTQVLQAEQPLEEALESVAFAIQEATPFEVVLMSVYDERSQSLQRVSSAGIPLDKMAELKSRTQPWTSAMQLLKPEFCLGRVYFIPHEQMPIVPVEVHTVTLLSLEGAQRTYDQWHPEDFLLVPLYHANGLPLGMISVDAPRNGLRPDRTTIETLEIFSTQAALAIENHIKLSGLRLQLDDTVRDLERAQMTSQDAQSHLPVLLHKDLEQTLTIQRLSNRAWRIGAGLDIAEIINQQTTREGVLLSLGHEFLTRMDVDIVLVAEQGPDGPRMVDAIGMIPQNVNPEALLGQRNPLRQTLQNGEILLVSTIDETSEWVNAPLLHALDTKGFICLPIKAEDKIDSALLAISHKPLGIFASEDEQLYNLITQQVAVTLQNLNLLNETKRRLREVNLLMDFSRQLGSLEQASILQTLVESAMRVIPAAQAAMVALWEPGQGALTPQFVSGYADGAQLMQVTYRPGEALAGQAFEQGMAIRLDEVDFARHYNLSSENLLRYRNATAGQLPASSIVAPIIGTTRDEPLGVLAMDNFKLQAAFSEEDVALIASLAQQTALTLENARLYQASEQRARQLQALTAVTTTITSSLEPDELVATLLDQLKAILPHNTGTLWLRHENQLVVRAARGFADSEQRVGLSVAVEDSTLLNEMINTSKPISVENVQDDPRFPTLMEYENLSWLGLPLIASGGVIGVIALEKTEPGFYTPEMIQLGTTFAGQAAVGLENASLYQDSLNRAQELDERTQRLVMLNRLSSELSSSLDSAHILGFATQELHQAIPCSVVTAVLFNTSGRALVHAEFPPTRAKLPYMLAHTPLFERLRQTMGIFHSEEVAYDSELAPLDEFLKRRDTHSLLILPMATGADLHGLLMAHTSVAYRFNTSEVELALTIANQAAIAVQNARLFAETRSLTEDLEVRVNERTTELGKEHQRTETLLRIITELSSSLDLEQVLNRTLKVLNEMIDAEQITVLISRPGEKNLFRLASVGYTEPVNSGGSPTPFGPADGLAGWVISHRQAALIDNVLEDPRWVKVEGGVPTAHRSALAVPLMIGAEALGSLLLFHRTPAHFSLDQLDLVQAAANQVAVAVNNAELYRLIRDQAEDLGGMLRRQQIENSRSKAILEAVADGVLVTDANKEITLFNASAENILDLSRTLVVGKSLEYFTGLFGGAAQSWKDTIFAWSQDPTAYEPGITYAEQITLENGRVVSVRLAPVIMRNDFLGTVSIFQDITHQVEVDRLKSEFVATVSHELRTPMTSIKGYVEILLMGAAGPLSEQQNRFLDIVKTNTERLAVLVNDLLDISRIESGRIKLSMQPLNLEEIAGEVLASLSHRSQEENKPVTIEQDVQPNLPRCLGDLDRVQQILANILDNAYHYNMPNGSITLRMHQVGDEIQVDVKDTGMGIPPEEQERVFERFYRGESPLVLGVSGTGLGLSIVQNLVQMHHGRIWLESTGVAGEGCTFSFTLPVYVPEES